MLAAWALPPPLTPPPLPPLALPQVMTGDVADVPGIITTKGGLKFAGPEVEAMRSVAKAYEDRSLQAFQAALEAYAPQLAEDPIVHSHLSELYDTMLQQNLTRLVEPYSRVEIAHIASLISLPPAAVEAKLSQMVLDGKLAGTLDQVGGGRRRARERASRPSPRPLAHCSLRRAWARSRFLTPPPRTRCTQTRCRRLKTCRAWWTRCLRGLRAWWRERGV